METISAGGVLLYGSLLVWAGLHTLRSLTSLVRPARPPAFVCLHLTTVWTVTMATMLVGIAVLFRGLGLLGA